MRRRRREVAVVGGWGEGSGGMFGNGIEVGELGGKRVGWAGLQQRPCFLDELICSEYVTKMSRKCM